MCSILSTLCADSADSVDRATALGQQSICKLSSVWEDAQHYALVTELCSGGELLERVDRLERFSERMAAKLVRRVLLALYVMHSRHMVHLDLKPQVSVARSFRSFQIGSDFLFYHVLSRIWCSPAKRWVRIRCSPSPFVTTSN